MTGKIILGNNSKTVELDETITIPGSQLSHIATTNINIVALINSGIVIENIAKVEIKISGNLSLHRAVTIPRIIAKGIPIKIAVTAKIREFLTRTLIISLIGFSPLKE
jgi:hypothetical protein